MEYEALGNQTKIPAVDAGEHEITASFYTDNQVAVQKQNGETTDYSYDPTGRTEKTVSEGGTKATVVNHYPGPGEAISWACEEAARECEEGKGTKWTRNIPGIDGSLGAVEKNGQAAVLQLHDLEGNVVATAAVSETETKLLTSYNPTEFGVPVNGTPPTKYSWLGAEGLATETSSGAANPGGGSYVPQLGRPLQTEPVVAPGAYANGSYNGMPYTTGVSAQSEALGSDLANGAPGREASRLAAAKKFQEEEEQKAREEEETLARINAPTPGEGGAEPGEAGSICEVAALTGQEADGCGAIESESEGATTSSVHSAGESLGPCDVHSVGYPIEAGVGTEWIFDNWAFCSSNADIVAWNVVAGASSPIASIGAYANVTAKWNTSLISLPDVDSGLFCLAISWTSPYGSDEKRNRCFAMTPR